jgi:N-ethylmaleimide reductase
MSSALRQKLISPVKIGPITLSHRIVMAPLTRMRSGLGDAPGELMVAYTASVPPMAA